MWGGYSDVFAILLEQTIMNTKKRGLGRGLEALLGNTATATQQNEVAEASELRHIPVEFLQPGKYQPRKDITSEALQDLANSIKAQGIIQPIVIRSVSHGRYEIIAGERRWRAAQIAGLAEIPVIIRDIPDNAAMAIALIENIQREDLNPLEEAVALQRLLDEFSMTHQQVADAVGKSRTSVTNLLRLLSLSEDAKNFLEKGALEMGHARALLGLNGEAQSKAAHTIVEKGLSVRECEELVRKIQNPAASGKTNIKAGTDTDPTIQDLQVKLSEKLGKYATIQHKVNGKGKVVLRYRSLLELRAIISNMID